MLLVLREPLGIARGGDGLGAASPLLTLLARTRRAGGPADEAARQAAETRLVRRLGEASDLLHPAGITVTALDAAQATAVLTAACNPDSLIPPNAALAGAQEVITTAPSADEGTEHGSRAA